MPEKENSQIKEAFAKVKEDIENLHYYLSILQSEIEQLKSSLEEIKQQTFQQTDRQTSRQTAQQSQTDQQFTKQGFFQSPGNQQITPANQQITPANTPAHPADENIPADKQAFQAPKSPNLSISTGNEGAPADRQTNQQTDRQTEEFAQFQQTVFTKDNISNIQRVSEIIDSLDSLKKEIRSQFKKLTNQEMLIFSTIYQLEDQGLEVDYPLLAVKTNLTESSIRDYVQKLLKKGVPLLKSKENNKKITLSIDPNFKKIAPLQTLITLRNL